MITWWVGSIVGERGRSQGKVRGVVLQPLNVHYGYLYQGVWGVTCVWVGPMSMQCVVYCMWEPHTSGAWGALMSTLSCAAHAALQPQEGGVDEASSSTSTSIPATPPMPVPCTCPSA